MAEQIKQRERVTRFRYELCYYKNGDIAYGFPLTNGVVLPTENILGEDITCDEKDCPWWDNYLSVKDNSEYQSKVEKIIDMSYTEPAHFICECGKEITISYDAEECEYCGRLHNIFGQELLPRNMWEDDYEYDY